MSPDASEAEAERASAAAARGGRVGSMLSPVGVQVQRAVTDWTPPVRADEAGTTLDARTTEVPNSGGAKGFDKFSVFVPAAGIDKAKVTQYDLVDALGTQSGQRSRIDGDQRILFSAVPQGTSHTLSDYMAAIGYVRLLQDLKATKSDVAALIAAAPLVDAQLTSLTLPPRGTFMSFGGAGVGVAAAVVNSILPFASGNLGVDLVSWVRINHAALDAILAIDNDASKGGLLAFLNNATYPNGMNVIGFTGWFSRYIAAHHFFVAEIAHELVE